MKAGTLTWGLLRYTLITATIGEADKGQTERGLLYDEGNGQWDIPEPGALINEILLWDSVREDFLVEHDLPDVAGRV